MAKQSGQAMIEYTVVLFFVTFATGLIHTIGLNKDDKDDKDSLLKAMHTRYSYQSAALKMSDLPEYASLDEIRRYYSRLNKYPNLGTALTKQAVTLNKLRKNVDQANAVLEKLNRYKKQSVKQITRDLLP